MGLALGIGAASASAAVVPAQAPTATFDVKGSNGYWIQARIGDLGATLATETASFDESPFRTGATYTAPQGRSNNDKFSAAFGHMGKISVRFDPSGKVRHEDVIGCRGAEETVRFGTFRGTVRFQGEGGYTELRRNRVAGEVASAPRQVCEPPRPSESRKPRPERPLFLTSLSASSPLAGVSFVASRLETEAHDGGISAYNVLASETREGMEISRFVVKFDQGLGFRFDPGLQSAAVAPPAPFSGTANFQRIDSYASRWEGPLAVSFSGRPDVPLTGPDFSWSLTTMPLSIGSFPSPFADPF